MPKKRATPSGFRPGDSYAYLINRVASRIFGMFSERLKPYDLTIPMFRILSSIHDQSGQRLNQLSEATSLDMSTLSRLVGILEERGLLTRSRPEGNNRVVAISLTAPGVALTEELIDLSYQFEQAAIHSFGDEDVSWMKKSLRAVYDHLEAFDSSDVASR